VEQKHIFGHVMFIPVGAASTSKCEQKVSAYLPSITIYLYALLLKVESTYPLHLSLNSVCISDFHFPFYITFVSVFFPLFPVNHMLPVIPEPGSFVTMVYHLFHFFCVFTSLEFRSLP